jgi:ribosome-associated toxin RatA of RatAB toxin-antitoxin module
MVTVMAIRETREVVIEATPKEILDVIADLESLPEWSGAHQSSEILETGADGRPAQAKMKVKTAGITDEQVVAYTWADDSVSWTLVTAGQQRSQDAKYTLTPEGKGARVKFDITIDPLVPLPGFMLKRAVKGVIDTATDGLRKRVLQVNKGS